MFTKNTAKIIPFFRCGEQGSFPACGHRYAGSQKGFTLIEVVATLVIVGILATLGGFGIVEAVKGYATVKQNAAATEKAQLAMSRINREIIEMNTVYSAATSANLPIYNMTQTDSSGNIIGSRTIGFDSSANAVRIALGSNAVANGDILIDNVKSLTFTYYQCSNASTTWPTGQDNVLSTVGVNMTLISPNITLTSVVAPRNNGNIGCVQPNTSINYGSHPSGWGSGCFIATAAYGDPAHPMVQILREFRDRHLVRWPGGRWFVGQYYKYGPAAADMIRNRPLAMGAVRCVLAPFVAFAFCLMYAPLAIILIVSLIVAVALFAAIRRGMRRSVVSRTRGSILVGLIFTMVIMAVLAAAMLPLFSASYMDQVYADLGRKAYYLAESGFRYAGSVYRYANSDDASKNAALSSVNNKTFTLLNNAGSFTTVVYPLWFSASATSANATSIATVSPGTVSSEFSGTSSAGYIYISSAGYYSYSSFSVTGANVVFSGLAASSPTTSSLTAVAANTTVLPVAKTASSSQSLSNGGNGSLTLSSGYGVFPLLNGNFTLNPAPSGYTTSTVFHYKTRSGNTLNNITLVDSTLNSNWTSSMTISASTNVTLSKFVRIVSTGTAGLISRTVTYDAPIGWLSGAGKFQKVQDDDIPNSNSNWTNSIGTYATSTVNGASALAVTGTSSVSGVGTLALTYFTGYSNVSLPLAWLEAEGFLSYDLQVKVYQPDNYFFAGPVFRVRTNSSALNMYGVSLVKPRASSSCFLTACATWTLTSDQITNLIPGGIDYTYGTGTLFPSSVETSGNFYFGTGYEYGLPAIVLWKRTGSSGTFTWLAYRTLTTSDYIIYNNGSGYPRLTSLSTLLVRVAEGYSLIFTAGNTGTPIHEGDTVCNSSDCSGETARVVMTPILTAGAWTSSSPAAGTLVLANVWNNSSSSIGSFSSGDSLYVSGVKLATAGTFTATKQNYIRVYFSDPTARGTEPSTVVEKDEIRLANARGYANWPPDDLTSLTSSNDYYTLVQWTDYNGISAMASTSEPNAIIVDGDLVTATWTTQSTTSSFSGDSIGLMTSTNNATDTAYDDFAIQLDMNNGTGFLTPIQY